MSAENALISRARPYMLTAKAHAMVQNEVGKGCRADIAPVPVALEPPYTPDLVEWLSANTYNNEVLQNVPPWCSNRLPTMEFAPRYLFYPKDPLYEDLYFTY